ncbi:MAG: hypothetical protein JWP12_3279 [Bacteroidetes bacterium]|nr:hypothetical protein [Bacteroidota bacterium]
MADFFFFTDIDLLNSQSSSQAYGPAGISGTDEQFRVTSLHTATGTPKAYAICDGTVCIQQDQGNTNLVNLILKPSNKPRINCATIKYIIYKGILKNSLLDGSGNVLNTSNNDLTGSVKTSWDAFLFITGQASVPPSEKALGIDLDATITNFDDSDLIDNLFYREGITYQFPKVTAGWDIGNFDPAGFGFEIITESVGYDPILKFTRNQENFIKVPQLPTTPTPTDADIFKYWHDKEEILNFIDAGAFYGSFYADTIRAKTTSGTFNKTSGNDIYDKVLKGTQHTTATNGNFYNRNCVFLDIRNEHNQSFNYYKNYGNFINISLQAAAIVNSDYYTNNWPVLILNSSGSPLFPAGNTSSKNTIKINLPIGDNEFPVVYISQGYKNKLFSFRKQLRGKDRFIEPTTPTGYTSDIELATPNRDSNTDTTVISCIIKLRYFKKLNRKNGDPPTSSGTVIRSTDFMDSLFPLLKMGVPFPFSTVTGLPKVRVKVYNEEVYVDWLNEQGIDFVADIGIAVDTDTVTLFAFAKDIHKNPQLFRTHNQISFNSETDSNSDFFMNYADNREKLNQLTETLITLNYLIPPQIQTLKMEAADPSFLEKFTVPLYETQFIAIIFKKTAFDDIKITLGGLSNYYKIFLGVANRNDRDGTTANDQSNDNPPIKYFRYDIMLKGFTIDGSGNITATEYLPLDVLLNSYTIYN